MNLTVCHAYVNRYPHSRFLIICQDFPLWFQYRFLQFRSKNLFILCNHKQRFSIIRFLHKINNKPIISRRILLRGGQLRWYSMYLTVHPYFITIVGIYSILNFLLKITLLKGIFFQYKYVHLSPRIQSFIGRYWKILIKSSQYYTNVFHSPPYVDLMKSVIKCLQFF